MSEPPNLIGDRDSRIGMRYTHPVTVEVTSAMSLCLCGFNAQAEGPNAQTEVNDKFKAHVCPFSAVPVGTSA